MNFSDKSSLSVGRHKSEKVSAVFNKRGVIVVICNWTTFCFSFILSASLFSRGDSEFCGTSEEKTMWFGRNSPVLILDLNILMLLKKSDVFGEVLV